MQKFIALAICQIFGCQLALAQHSNEDCTPESIKPIISAASRIDYSVRETHYRPQLVDPEKWWRSDTNESSYNGLASQYWKWVGAADRMNDIVVSAILRRCGWPNADKFGKNISQQFFMLIQHGSIESRTANESAVLAAYRRGDLSSHDYAIFVDRRLVDEGKPQRFGTQMRIFEKNGIIQKVVWNVEEEEQIDARRMEIGLEPICTYLARLEGSSSIRQRLCK